MERELPLLDVYTRVGGRESFVRLVEAFYAGLETDPVLRPMYPEGDLGPAKERLVMFLVQTWGGPRTYDARRGHPRLKNRHRPFLIDTDARDRWLVHMRAAIDSLDLSPGLESTLWAYLSATADHLINVGRP